MNKEILRLAIPNIISNISVPLLSTVDTALMGRMSELHIGAVGIGSMIFNFIYWNFGFLRMGTTGLTAQGFGQKNDLFITHTLGRAGLISLFIAFFLLLLQWPLGNLAFQLMGVNDTQASLVADYFYLRIMAAPATLLTYVLIGWFFGMQNAIFPLIITITVNIVNIVLSFIFVSIGDMEVKGVALGTMIAQYVGLILGIVLFLMRYRYLLSHLWQGSILQWQSFKSFLQLNSDIFLRTLLLTFAFAYFYRLSAADTATILAVNVILLQFVNWMSYGIDGFAFATESLVGKYAGAGDLVKTNLAIRKSFIWGMGTAVLYSIIYGILGMPLLYVFTNQTEVIQAAQPYLIWVVLFPVISTPCYFVGWSIYRLNRFKSHAQLYDFGLFDFS